jgi:hypothetical protein
VQSGEGVQQRRTCCLAIAVSVWATILWIWGLDRRAGTSSKADRTYASAFSYWRALTASLPAWMSALASIVGNNGAVCTLSSSSVGKNCVCSPRSLQVNSAIPHS